MTMRRDARTGMPDVLTTFHFFLDLGADAEAQAIFTECSPVEMETEVLPVEEGGLNDFVHRLPGRSKVSDITLKQGIAISTSQNNFFWHWYLQTRNGRPQRREVSIVVRNQRDEEVQRWNLHQAYPIKWVGPGYNSGQSTVAIQSLTLTHEGIDATKG